MKKKLFIVFLMALVGTCAFCKALQKKEEYIKQYSLIKNEQKYGIIDEDKNLIIKPNYKNITIKENGFTLYKDDGSKEIYNSDSKLIYTIAPHTKIMMLNNDESILNKNFLLNRKTGEINSYNYNDFIKQTGYINCYGFFDGLALVMTKETIPNFAVGDINGNIVCTDIQQAGFSFSEGLLPVILLDGRSGFINTKGELVIETTFYIDPDDLSSPRKYPALTSSFKEDVALVKNKKNKWVLFDRNGTSVEIPDEIKLGTINFSEDLVTVYKTESNQKKYGYMDKNLNITIPYVFDHAENFIGKYAVVIYQGKEAILDNEGNIYLSEDLLNGNEIVYTNVKK